MEITKESIVKKLKNKIDLHFFDTVESTNTVAKMLAEKGAIHGTAVVALQQRKGRGRLGKGFFSPHGGIYLSVVLRPSGIEGITPAAAVTVCKTLENYGFSPYIKWVNDIFLGGKKVCGILTEGKLPHYAILGIGINYSMPTGGFPKEIQDIAGALYSGEEQDKAGFIAAVIDGVFDMDTQFYIDEYRSRCPMSGSEVEVLFDGESKHATVLEITDLCGLKIRLADGETKVLTSGEVSIKGFTGC